MLMCATHAILFFFFSFPFLVACLFLLFLTSLLSCFCELLCNTALVFWKRSGNIPKTVRRQRWEAFVVATGDIVFYMFGIFF
jgi:hypothetical protein